MIEGTTEIIIPQVEQKIANAYWLQELNINAPSPLKPVNVFAIMVPYNKDTGELFESRTVRLSVEDILTKSATDIQLGAVVNALLAEIERQAKLQNKI